MEEKKGGVDVERSTRARRSCFLGLAPQIPVCSLEGITTRIISNIMPLRGGRWNTVENAQRLFTMPLKCYLFFLLKQKSWVENVSSDCLCCSGFVLLFYFLCCFFFPLNVLYNEHILLFNGLPAPTKEEHSNSLLKFLCGICLHKPMHICIECLWKAT